MVFPAAAAAFDHAVTDYPTVEAMAMPPETKRELCMCRSIFELDAVHPAEDHALAADYPFFVFGGVKNVQRAWNHGR